MKQEQTKRLPPDGSAREFFPAPNPLSDKKPPPHAVQRAGRLMILS